MKKFLRKLHCQRNIQPNLQNSCDCLSPKLISELSNLYRREWPENAGQFSNAHSNEFTEDNEQGRPIYCAKSRVTENTESSSFFPKKNKITKFVSFLISMILPLIPASNGHVSYFSLIQMVRFFTFITYYSCSVRVISCGNRKVTLDTPKTEETGQRSL